LLAVTDTAQLDVLGLEWAQSVRWTPLTAFFVLASAWWVKGPLFILIGALRDVTARRLLPLTALTALGSVLLADLLSSTVKQLVDRPRPALSVDSIQPAVTTPPDPSFPSGHTTTAFAAAVAVSVLHPKLRVPMIAIAALVGLSRVYLGMHFPLDVMAGAVLGTAVGLTMGFAARAALTSAPWKRSSRIASRRSSPATTPSRAETYSGS
jgi:undecaprenyl-diphosphatase